MSDWFDLGNYELPIVFRNTDNSRSNCYWLIAASRYNPFPCLETSGCPIEYISLADQAQADSVVLTATKVNVGALGVIAPGQSINKIFRFSIVQTGFLYLSLPRDPKWPVIEITSGATSIGIRTDPTGTVKMEIYRITNPLNPPQPGPSPIPAPIPAPDDGTELPPEPPWDFSSISSTISSLWEHIKWLLMLILAPLLEFLNWLKKIYEFLLDLPNMLDRWISHLFGVDPSLPFFDEVLKKLDIWISGKFGVDPSLPFWEELVKKAIGWLGGGIDEAAGKAIERLK